MGQISGQLSLDRLPRDKVREERDASSRLVEAEAIAQVGEEGDAELLAGLHEPEHDVAGLTAICTHRAARDPALSHAGAQIIFGGIGVERDFGSLQHHQQFILPSVQPDQQLIQILVARALPEDVVEALGKEGAVRLDRGQLPMLQMPSSTGSVLPELEWKAPGGGGPDGNCRLYLGRQPYRRAYLMEAI